jgi:hypothetical protein
MSTSRLSACVIVVGLIVGYALPTLGGIVPKV